MKKQTISPKNHYYGVSGTILCTFFLLVNNPVQTLADEFQGTLNSVSIVDVEETNNPPTAKISYTRTGNTYSFDASSSTDSDGNIESYKWNFGDGTKGEGETVTHTYTAGEAHEVQLTVTDNMGGITITRTEASKNLIKDGNNLLGASWQTTWTGIVIDSATSWHEMGNNNWARILGQSIQVTKGQKYQLSFEYKSTGPLDVGVDSALHVSLPASDSWTTVSRTGTAWENTDNAKVTMDLEPGKASQHRASIRNMVLTTVE